MIAWLRRRTRTEIVQAELDDCWFKLREAVAQREGWQLAEQTQQRRHRRLEVELRKLQGEQQ